MTRRRWIADRWDERTAALTGDQASHLVRVLRAERGMEFDLVCGDRVWHARIAGISGDAVEFALLGEVEAAPALPVTLLLSIFKFDRMEWALEKVTELGVARIVPVIARRTEKHLGQAAANRVERWRRVAYEAAKQSRRSDVPVIENPVPLKDALRARAAENGLRVMLDEQERALTLRDAIAPERSAADLASTQVVLAVGPEGGWTAGEHTLFAAERWTAVTLGPRILRAETAAITAVAVVAALT